MAKDDALEILTAGTWSAYLPMARRILDERERRKWKAQHRFQLAAAHVMFAGGCALVDLSLLFGGNAPGHAAIIHMLLFLGFSWNAWRAVKVVGEAVQWATEAAWPDSAFLTKLAEYDDEPPPGCGTIPDEATEDGRGHPPPALVVAR